MTPPALEQLQGATRNGDRIAGIGESRELASALFDGLGAGEMGAQVYKISEPDAYVVVKLTSREEADMEKFAKEAPEIRDSASRTKGIMVYVEWLDRHCKEAAAANQITVNEAYLKNEDSANIPYELCASNSTQRAYQQFISRMRLELMN